MVALTWQTLIAHAAGVALAWPERAVLASGIWMAYVVDRWLEGWRLEVETIQTERHRFYHTARWPVAILWALVLMASLTVSVARLSSKELRAGTVLLAPVLAYLLSHQLIHRSSRRRLPKEVCVAALMAAGAGLFVVVAPHADLTSLATPLTLFGLLCFSNCALISAWEHEVDAVHGQTSLVTDYARGAALAHRSPLLLALVSAALALLQPSTLPSTAWVCLSSVLLAAVDRAEPALGRRIARVLADLVLLTPLLSYLVRIHP